MVNFFMIKCDWLTDTVNPHELPLRVLSKNKRLRNQLAGPTPVPNLDDVQPFMSVPDFVGKPGPELQALLTSQHFQNPYPYPGNIKILFSYEAEPPDSAYSNVLRDHAKHALLHAWRYDPFRCSVKGAWQLPQRLTGKPNHGLTKDEFHLASKRKLRSVKMVRSAAPVDVKQARQMYKWTKNMNEHDDVNSLDGSDLDQELNGFYGSGGVDLRPIDDYSDEGFFEPNPLSTTIVSLPDKSLMEEGVTPGGIFQDSGISMDERYAEYSQAHSVPNTAKETTGNVPGDWPSFNADVRPLRMQKKKGRWLGLVGDQKQCEWPGRCEGPYDLDGLRSHVTNQMVDGPSSDTTHEHPLPAEVVLPNESMQYTQDNFQPLRVDVNSEPPRDAPQSSDREQPFPRDNNKNPIITQEFDNNEVSVGAAHPMPHGLDGSIENGGDSEPSVSAPHAIAELLQSDIIASLNSRRTRLTTPVSRRTGQIHQIQIDTPATPETVNIHLTPENNRIVDAVGGSGRSLESQVPHSPTTKTQRGQSALGRYVQETKRHPDLSRQKSSTMSLNGSESEEDPLTSAQKRPGPPEVHGAFKKAVRLHQKRNDAMFTLSPPKASTTTPSPSKRAPIPITPASVNDFPPFRPTTPFQLGTPARPDLDSPGTPTPAPKASKKRKQKSVMNVFRSPKLGSRSPERHAQPPPTSDFVVAPAIPTAGATDPTRTASFIGSRGLLFQKTKTNERGTKYVLNSLKLTPERGAWSSFSSECEALEDEYEDELAGPALVRPPRFTATGSRDRGTSNNVFVTPRVRSRDEMDEGFDGLEQESSRKRGKKTTTTTRRAMTTMAVMRG